MRERCLWTETAPALPPRAMRPLPDRADVAIIGGGYTGLSAARTLGRQGADVVLLEEHTVGWGASGRNGGFILPGFKPEMEELAQRLGPTRAGRMFQLTLQAIRGLEQIISEEGISCEFARCGAITLA